ncbi:hypothetical protein [Membranihabitans maritimus]|uniref:hypothetical protein n=1 Tax=Membranihabitans maritimus TaxID=2904244 RepID=UPI001F18E0B3|nr:hypothetical protein [Membranihabitans maritimus]
MTKKINRRTFLTHAGYGLRAIPLTGLSWSLVRNSVAALQWSQSKKLIATTDYTVSVGRNHRGSRYSAPIPRSDEYYADYKHFMNKTQLDELHRVLASLGVTRHQWIVDTYWDLYENYPHGFNLLEEVVKSAHTHGIEVYAVIKPFEGGGFGTILPHSMPIPEETAVKDLRGIFPLIRPFVAQNPHLCLKCKPGKYEYKTRLKKIRLIKSDDKPTRIKEQHLTLFTSATNNKFEVYKGPVNFRESVEWCFRFPLWKKCRVIHLDGLDIPATHKYVLIKCSLADDTADFGNEKGNILELEGVNGKIVPHYLGEGPVHLKNHLGFYQSKVSSEIYRYLKNPEVLSEIDNATKMEKHYQNFYSFDTYKVTDPKILDKDGYIVAACGKPEYLLGNLHPIYPEVRNCWLEMTRFCLDQGVDGINYRIANHSKLPDYWDYGFNEPVLEATGGRTDYPTISRINGDAYTQFLREARELIKSRGKKLTHHLHGSMLIPDDRGRLPSLPPNFEWQWETWVKEIADELEFRGGFMLHPWNLTKALDIFTAVTQEAKKPFYYQGDFHGMTFDGPFKITKEEIDLVNNHPGLDGMVLYETANFTKISNNEKVVGSPEHGEIIEKYFFRKR